MKEILDNVRLIRESMGYSQEKVAEEINLSQSKYARFERGATKTDLETLKKVADLFEMSLLDLLAYPRKIVDENNELIENSSEAKVVLQIELRKEKKDQVLKLIFGDNNLEIFSK